jgi:hypothetical protein
LAEGEAIAEVKVIDRDKIPIAIAFVIGACAITQDKGKLNDF